MIMSPSLRKFALTAHITSSIGWFGAVAAFLALAIAGLYSPDRELVRASYLVMGLTTWFVIVPLALVSLLTGVVSSLGTRWGLFRYYWVILKLLITVLATLILLVHTQPIDLLAGQAARTAVLGTNLHGTQIQMVVASSLTLVVLLVLTVLSVYKPRGMTRYGQRKLDAAARPASNDIDAAMNKLKESSTIFLNQQSSLATALGRLSRLRLSVTLLSRSRPWLPTLKDDLI